MGVRRDCFTNDVPSNTQTPAVQGLTKNWSGRCWIIPPLQINLSDERKKRRVLGAKSVEIEESGGIMGERFFETSQNRRSETLKADSGQPHVLLGHTAVPACTGPRRLSSSEKCAHFSNESGLMGNIWGMRVERVLHKPMSRHGLGALLRPG